jgi:2-O-methyltransferase
MKLILLLIVGFIPAFSAQAVEQLRHRQVLRFVREFLPKDPVIVEAGAYDGSDTSCLARLWPKGRIYSFEPVPEHFSKLQARTRRLKNVKIFPQALSDQNGRAVFYLSQYEWSPSQVSQSSSILPPKEHLVFHPHIHFSETIEVETITLDDWARQERVDHVDFFWLDMQGYELNVLQNSDLAKSAKAIWMEVEFSEAYEGQYLFEDIRKWMESNDFELVGSDFDVARPADYYGNALFVKQCLLL